MTSSTLDLSPQAAPALERVRRTGLRALSDERLVERTQRGDVAAFAAIYSRHYQSLYRYCLSIVRDREDAADALQNAMLNALRALVGHSGEIKLRPWLFRIAHNEAITLLRRRRPEIWLPEELGLSVSAETQHDLRTELEELVGDLQELSERQRGALLMRELVGLDYREVGEALDVSGDAAKQSVWEARSALHDFAEGRRADCEEIRRTLSDHDRRRVRGRRIRAHLRACEECRRFEAALSARPAELAALAPPLSSGLAGAVLGGIFESGGRGGGLLTGWGGGAATGLGGAGAVQSFTAVIVALVSTASATVAAPAEDRRIKPMSSAVAQAPAQRAPSASGLNGDRRVTSPKRSTHRRSDRHSEDRVATANADVGVPKKHASGDSSAASASDTVVNEPAATERERRPLVRLKDALPTPEQPLPRVLDGDSAPTRIAKHGEEVLRSTASRITHRRSTGAR